MLLLATLLTAGWLLLLSPGTHALEMRLCADRKSQELSCGAGQNLVLTSSMLMSASVSSSPSPCTTTSVSRSVALPPWGLNTMLSQSNGTFDLCLLKIGPCNVSLDNEVFQDLQTTFSEDPTTPFSVLALQYQCDQVTNTMMAEETTEVRASSVILVRQPNPRSDTDAISCYACADSVFDQLTISILEMPLLPASLCSVTLENESKNLTLNCSSAAFMSNVSVVFLSSGVGVNITTAYDLPFDSRIVLQITSTQNRPVTVLCGAQVSPCLGNVTPPPTSTTTVSPPWMRHEVVFNANNPSQLLQCQQWQFIALSDVTFNEESCDSFSHRLPSMHSLVVATLMDRVIQPCSFQRGVCNISLSAAQYHVNLTQYHADAETPAIRVALGYKCVSNNLVAEPGKDTAVVGSNVYLAVQFTEDQRKKNITCAACSSSFYDRIRVGVLDLPKSNNDQCNLTLAEVNISFTVGCTDRMLLLFQDTFYVTSEYGLTFTLIYSETFTSVGPLWLNITSELGLPLQLWCPRDGRTPVCPTMSPTTPFVPPIPSTVSNGTGEVVIEPTNSEGLSIGSIVGICGGSAIFIVIVVSIALVARNKIRNNKKSIDPNPHANPDDDDDDESDDVEAARRPGTAAPGGKGTRHLQLVHSQQLEHVVIVPPGPHSSSSTMGSPRPLQTSPAGERVSSTVRIT